ncbi:3-phosphoserine/phosphohydroxythreonine transaminase [Hydrogenophaga sp. 5NK40-0174]|uniref:3-phosphoserine/phosphohydroxythreonine transaminase n=1 Tax=Hydrogenophaga sp. 5NK40-0174 TaxID=3127649 RepID=UPI003106C9CA
MTRPFNFSAGPAAMPEVVLQKAAAEMTDWHGCGMSVMEMSHRGKEFISIAKSAETRVRELLRVPETHHILFMQGGGLAENAVVPLNLGGAGAIDMIVTGSWSQKSAKEAARYGTVNLAASNQADGHNTLPDPASWSLSKGARYVHICSNETIHGVEFHELPDLKTLGSDAPLVIDFSSHVASRPVDWSKVGLAFGGAQKNLGPAGVTLVVVRDDLLDKAMDICPSAFSYRNVADNESMFNTPPTFAIYMLGLVFDWLAEQTHGTLKGVEAIEQKNIAKAQRLYDFLDGSSFYENRVAANCRSRMNIPFFLADESRNADFLAGASDSGLLQLKGHKSVGGMRASIYNAMPMAGVEALIAYMTEFERTQA